MSNTDIITAESVGRALVEELDCTLGRILDVLDCAESDEDAAMGLIYDSRGTINALRRAVGLPGIKDFPREERT